MWRRIKIFGHDELFNQLQIMFGKPVNRAEVDLEGKKFIHEYDGYSDNKRKDVTQMTDIEWEALCHMNELKKLYKLYSKSQTK